MRMKSKQLWLTLGLIACLNLIFIDLPEAQNTGHPPNLADVSYLTEHLKLHATIHANLNAPYEMIIEEMSYSLIFIGEALEPKVMLKVKGRKKQSDGNYADTSELMFLEPHTRFKLQIYDTRTEEVKDLKDYTGQ